MPATGCSPSSTARSHVALRYLLRKRNVTFQFGEEVVAGRAEDDRVITHLEAARRSRRTRCCTRPGARARPMAWSRRGRGSAPTDAAGSPSTTTSGPRSRTSSRWGCGGPPGLAATSMEQGRIAALTAFGEPVPQLPTSSRRRSTRSPRSPTSARTRRSAEAAVPYVVGIAWYRELAKAMMMREEDGLLKSSSPPRTSRCSACTSSAQQATDLVHIGQALMGREARSTSSSRRVQLPDAG